MEADAAEETAGVKEPPDVNNDAAKRSQETPEESSSPAKEPSRIASPKPKDDFSGDEDSKKNKLIKEALSKDEKADCDNSSPNANGNAKKNDSVSKDEDDNHSTTNANDDATDRDDSKNDDNNNDNDDDDDDDDDDDGRELSEYELLRLERIKRNREYLSRLGLANNNSLRGNTKPAPRKRKKPVAAPPSSPIRASARARKTVNYTEPSISVAKLLQGAEKKKEPPKKREPKGRKHSHRMERFIFREFQRIKSLKTQTAKDAERYVRAAEKELVYWKRRADLWQNQDERRKEAERIRKLQEEERADFGGGTLKELLRNVDRRMPELLSALSKYDEEYEAAGKAQEREAKRLENEQRMKLLGALKLYPKALKSSTSLLNSVLRARAPEDPQPSRRRSRRSGVDQVDESPAPKKRGRKALVKPAAKNIADADDWFQNSEDPGSFVDEETLQSSSLFRELQRHQLSPQERSARNVGGWISPSFAQVIDRTWLDNDCSVTDFNPTRYVPQVGDVVLYYPAGHQLHLKSHPDVLGAATGEESRIPLWIRANAEKENLGNSKTGNQSDAWWSDRWLEGFHNGFGYYPIICRVQSTHAEFPPDPYTKISHKDTEGNITKITWKAPKDPGVLRRSAGTALRLAIELRPLTPVLPPTWSASGPRDETKLSLPPIFTVVSFPCKLKPFVVPFVWAYRAAHSFSTEEKVLSVTNPEAGKVQVRQVAMLDKTSGSMRLDDKLPFLRTLAKLWETPVETRACLEEDLANYGLEQGLPLRDTRAISTILKEFLERHDDSEIDEEVPRINVVDFIRSTLPLWDSVTAMPNAYNRAKLLFSPWELVPHNKARRASSTFQPFSLDDGLRDMVEFLIEDMLVEDPSAGLFEYPVDEEDAPSYNCAVPLNMSLSRILTRLQSSRGGDHRCYYRGVGSLLEDFDRILSNCLLYNSPTSPVVEAALGVTGRLKALVAKSAMSCYKDLSISRMIDEKRYERALPRSSVDSDDASGPFHSTITTLKTPFRSTLYRDWLLPQPASTAGKQMADWFPQVGDLVLYSGTLHATFVEHHKTSLLEEQCSVLRFSDVEEVSIDKAVEGADWVEASVTWSEISYPKALPKGHIQAGDSFSRSSVLLGLCLDIRSTGTVGKIYWRPCMFSTDSQNGDNLACVCGLSHGTSFLKPLPVKTSGSNAESLSATDTIERADQLLGLLKRKCLRENPITFIDSELTKANVKQGYKPTQIKGRIRSLPKYEHLIATDFDEGHDRNSVTTRGVPRKSLVQDPARDLLCDYGFLPRWCKGMITKESSDSDKYATVMPVPECSLELVQARMRNHHYRHITAVENDILEGFVTVAVLLLKDAPNRKKLSLKRISKGLSAGGEVRDADSTETIDIPAHVAQEEANLVERLIVIRDLYAVALMAATYGTQLSCLFGVMLPVEKSALVFQTSDPVQDPARADAQKKLSFLLSAVGRDKSHKTKDKLPTINIKIKCGDEFVSNTKEVRVIDHCLADWKDAPIKVKFVSRGKLIPFHEDIDPSDEKQDDASTYETERVTETCVAIEQSDLEGSELLSQYFFGRPGLREPCARCKVYKRSFLACRVKKGHANVDFDWVSTFKGAGGIDGLLRTLSPGFSGPSAQSTAEPVATELEGALAEKNSSNENAEGKTGGVENDAAEEEEEAVDPREFVEKAEECLALAKALQVQATAYSSAPARLETDFIKKAMPIDQSDGHFVYCVVCGISGDLLCCDGCANVVHSHCIKLAEVPEGEWFCEECEISGRAGTRKRPSLDTESSGKAKADSTTPEAENEEGSKALPFERVEFDHEKLKEVSECIESLNSSRPERQKRSKDDRNEEESGSEAEDDEASRSDESSLEEISSRYSLRKRRRTSIGSSQGGNGRKKRDKQPTHSGSDDETTEGSKKKLHRRSKAAVANEAEDEPPPVKRGRGRPRKVVAEPEPSPKRRGWSRTKKVKHTTAVDSEPASSSPKRRGRPNKKLATPVVESPKRPRGRPRKTSQLKEERKETPKPRGRQKTKDNTPKRRGRPRKTAANKEDSSPPDSPQGGRSRRGKSSAPAVSLVDSKGQAAPPPHGRRGSSQRSNQAASSAKKTAKRKAPKKQLSSIRTTTTLGEPSSTRRRSRETPSPHHPEDPPPAKKQRRSLVQDIIIEVPLPSRK